MRLLAVCISCSVVMATAFYIGIGVGIQMAAGQ